MRLGIYVSNPIIGDFNQNAQQIINASNKANKKGAKLLLTPEFSLCGSPADDLLLNPEFIKQGDQTLKYINHQLKIPAIICHPQIVDNKLYNTATLIYPNNSQPQQTVIQNNPIDTYYFKKSKYFQSSEKNPIFKYENLNIKCLFGNQNVDSEHILDCDLIINLDSSPYYLNKKNAFESLNVNSPLIYLNRVGGQDQWVFDGKVIISNPHQNQINHLSVFGENLVICDFYENKINFVSTETQNYPNELSIKNEIENIYLALKSAIGDYINKNNFNKVFIGLSGGIDSAVVACVTNAAIKNNQKIKLELVMMPSPYTSKISIDAAKTIAENLQRKLHFCPIDNYFQYLKSELQPFLDFRKDNFTQENLQARIRANILMAFANQDNGLVVNTSNRSEGAVGYGTLYGDLIGGYALIKDLYKQQVRELAKYINQINEFQIIPEIVITRPPSAELRKDQKDEDSIPKYELLDSVLIELLEKQKSPSEIIKMGFEKNVVKKIISLYYQNEYKRRQFPLGLNIANNSENKIDIPVNHSFYEFLND